MRTIPLLSGLYQICDVTPDLDAGMRQLTAIHGIGGGSLSDNEQNPILSRAAATI